MSRRSQLLPAVTVTDLQSRVAIDVRTVRRIVRSVIVREGGRLRGELGVTFLGDRAIRRLNRDFHGRDCVTDVLAFDLGSRGVFLADIVISTDTAAANAKRFRTTPLYETLLYLIHGTLHLLGYDDGTSRERKEMRKKEAYYLKKLKIRNGDVPPGAPVP